MMGYRVIITEEDQGHGGTRSSSLRRTRDMGYKVIITEEDQGHDGVQGHHH